VNTDFLFKSSINLPLGGDKQGKWEIRRDWSLVLRYLWGGLDAGVWGNAGNKSSCGPWVSGSPYGRRSGNWFSNRQVQGIIGLREHHAVESSKSRARVRTGKEVRNSAPSYHQDVRSSKNTESPADMRINRLDIEKSYL